MNNRYYVLTVVKTSQDTETRDFAPYNDYVIALRKYHEALTGIGTGCKGIIVELFDPWLNIVAKETWVEPEPEPEPKPEPETEPEPDTENDGE